MADIFDKPIPGQSLTQEMGSMPFEQPPQYTDIEEALEEIFDKLTSTSKVTELVLTLEQGVPVEMLARTIVFDGFLKGKWTPDMAMLMVRIVAAMIISIAVKKGVSPTIFNEDTKKKEFMHNILDLEARQGKQVKLESESKFKGLWGAV